MGLFGKPSDSKGGANGGHQSTTAGARPRKGSNQKADRRSSHLFIEMEESHLGSKWSETGRWNHALEEERALDDTGHEVWSRPHLPTLSVPALVHLRQALGAKNVRCIAIQADI